MEIIIAIGLGVWFITACLVSTIATFKSFKER